ncbi:MAG: FKBP-type peptidyl-prolyl cis-trans isomerase [Candidatus Pacebacteria bacterium]|nr:FKBP-type peptidyl-prolyl cis-trans isomerase [Candidatus Paceibacterota bacterium]
MNRQNLIKNILLIVLFIVLMYFVFQSFTRKEEVNNNEEGETVNITIDDMQINEKKVDIEVLKEGEGESSKVGDTLSVHYTGTFENGEKFDSSLDRGIPFEFTLGRHSVIKGWEEGMLNMKVGEKRKLFIPYELAYGENGYGTIPPKSNLTFEVELLEIK